MITSKRNCIVVWAHFGFNSRRYEMLMPVCFTCLCNLTHHKLRCVGKFNRYVPWLMIYVPAQVMPASILAHLCKLLYTKPMLIQNCSVTQQSSRTELHFRQRVSYSSGWIASPATRDCLSWHCISWRLLAASRMLTDYSRCVVI